MALHFVGFKNDRVHAAEKVFGKPDFYHRQWDIRALADVAPDDTVIFAGDWTPPSERCWDDSRQDIIARGGERGVDYVV